MTDVADHHDSSAAENASSSSSEQADETSQAGANECDAWSGYADFDKVMESIDPDRIGISAMIESSKDELSKAMGAEGWSRFQALSQDV